MKIAQQIKIQMARTILARVRETKAVGLSGMEVKNDLIRMLRNYIK